MIDLDRLFSLLRTHHVQLDRSSVTGRLEAIYVERNQ